ncbi:hypothetical protein [Accumulibacter sp.]|uniref:beta strand repeat-containing protein n=1 Tax=Accumulibacter sp. TaxID=2053492 RepID=UPI002D1F9ECB|nr:hypothetical protein [Accumulibacter sp.]
MAALLAAPTLVQAAVTSPNQMPGAGTVVVGNVAADAGNTKGGAAGTTITGLATGATLTVTGSSVVTWGASAAAALEPAVGGNPGGFNLGSGATLNFKAAAPVGLLNVDVSGSASSINGSLADTSAAGGGVGGVAVFIANRNGVVVGSTAKIALPAGFGALGVNLEGATAQTDFAAGKLDLNMSGAAPVTIEAGAKIGRDAAAALPNSYVLLAGSTITNAGTINSQQVVVDAGAIRNTPSAPILGQQTAFTAGKADSTATGVVTSPMLAVTTNDSVAYATATGSFTNSGIISSAGSPAQIWVNGPVTNSGTLSAGSASSASTLFVRSNGFTNTGTLATANVDIWNASAAGGNVALGGTVGAFAGAASPTNSLNSVFIDVNGNVSVTAPITVANSFNNNYIIRGNAVTISAAQNVAPTADGVSTAHGDIILAVNSPLQNITIASGGSLAAGSVNLGNLTASDLPNVNLSGNITAASGAGGITRVAFNGYTMGLDATGAATITTPEFDATVRGSLRNPVSTSNWLQNGLKLVNPSTTTPMSVNVAAVGGGFQAINLNVTGPVNLTSQDPVSGFTSTKTAFGGTGAGRPITTGTTVAGGLVANGGSQFIINASGNLNINPGVKFDAAHDASDGFSFPGGVVFKSAGTLTTNAVVDNAWTTVAQPFGGVFFEAPTIVALNYVATNGNSWVNFSTKPSTGVPTLYQFKQPSTTTLQFVVANDVAPHQNTYSALITGGAVNFDVLK